MPLSSTALRLSATIIALVCLVLLATSASAGAGAPLIYVDDDGDCGALVPCYDTIQQAVRQAIPPNTDIMVLPGTYNESVDLDEAAADTGGTHGSIALISVDEAGSEAAGATVDGGNNPAFVTGDTFQGSLRIDGFTVMSDQSDGVLVVAAEDVTIGDMTANGVSNGPSPDDTGDDGLDLTSLAGNVLVENSFANQTRPPGGDYADGFELKAPAGDVTVRGSQASHNKGSLDNDGIDIYAVGGNVLIENSIALDNGDQGFGVEAEGSVTVRASSDGSNADDGTQVFAAGDVLVEYHGSETNGDDGLDIVSQGDITVRHSRLRNNGDTGMDLSTYAGIVIDRVIVEGNNTEPEAFAITSNPFRRGGIEVHEYDVTPSVVSLEITNSLIRDNIGDGIYLPGIVDQAPVTITGNAICDNTEAGLSLFSSTVADATANWWGHASGPEHADNPGGTGDEVIYDVGGAIGDVDFEPWIETSHGEVLTPAVAGQPADIGFYFTDQAETVAMQGGPGMEGVPAFDVATDNGTVTSDEPGQQPGASTGASIGNGVLGVELTADTEGTANMTATGPCGLSAALSVPVEAGALHGDVDCNGAVNSVDSLKILRYVAGLSVSQTEPCTDIGTPALAAQTGGAVASVFGDVNCNGSVTSVDSLALLRYVAGLPPLSTPAGCPEIGT